MAIFNASYCACIFQDVPVLVNCEATENTNPARSWKGLEAIVGSQVYLLAKAPKANRKVHIWYGRTKMAFAMKSTSAFGARVAPKQAARVSCVAPVAAFRDDASR